MNRTAEDPPAPKPSAADTRLRRRWVLRAGSAALVVAAVGVVLAIGNPFDGAPHAGEAVQDNGAPTSLASVRQGPLASQISTTGTLGYRAQADGSPYSIVNQASGTFSQLPMPGELVRRGQVLYRVSGQPVVLLYGTTPMYRSLWQGDSGADVRELNRNLVALGYATASELDPTSDYFSAETGYALERLQHKLGVDETGSLTKGQAVFLPGPLRITTVPPPLGTTALAGASIAQATSTHRQVVVQLDAAQQSEVRLGDSAEITLPDDDTTAGVVTSIGTIAISSGSSSGSSGATIPVYITLKRPRDAGSLNQAPVQVQITTAGVKRALIVPVDALLSEPGGGYAVETVDDRGVHHLIAVTIGLFDDADGLVQVTSQSLFAGQRVVVPST